MKRADNSKLLKKYVAAKLDVKTTEKNSLNLQEIIFSLPASLPAPFPFCLAPPFSLFLFFSYFYASPCWSSWDPRRARWPPHMRRFCRLLLREPHYPHHHFLNCLSLQMPCGWNWSSKVDTAILEASRLGADSSSCMAASSIPGNLNESSDNRADDNIQRRSTSVLAESLSFGGRCLACLTFDRPASVV